MHFPLFSPEMGLRDLNGLQKNAATASAATWTKVSGSGTSGAEGRADTVWR